MSKWQPTAPGKDVGKLAAIIAVGYKVNSECAVQFRQWATTIIEEFIKGCTMDDERLKSGGSILSDHYFEEQLQRIREIRATKPATFFRSKHSGYNTIDIEIE